MALRVGTFDVEVTVRRQARPPATAVGLSERVTASYTRPVTQHGHGTNGRLVNGWSIESANAPRWPTPQLRELSSSKLFSGKSPVSAERFAVWNTDRQKRVLSDGMGSRVGERVMARRLDTPEPEQHVAEAFPRFVAPPIDTARRQPRGDAPPSARASAPRQDGFRPLFKLMGARAPRAIEPHTESLEQIARDGSAGRPLEEAAQKEMESFFATDFGDVRIHTDPSAAQRARLLGAEAYTIGKDI